MIDQVILEKLWKLNPSGNKKSIEDAIENLTNPQFNIRTPEGYLVTIDYLYDKYFSYLEYWKSKFSKTEERYIPKVDKKRDIYQFIGEGFWKNTYSISENPRDDYLFGPFDRKYLEKRIKEFMSKFNKKSDGEPRTINQEETKEIITNDEPPF